MIGFLVAAWLLVLGYWLVFIGFNQVQGHPVNGWQALTGRAA